jgi:hypothetical protein
LSPGRLFDFDLRSFQENLGLVINNPEIIQSDAPPVTLRLERKHPLAIRWMHWINFPVLFIMDP